MFTIQETVIRVKYSSYCILYGIKLLFQVYGIYDTNFEQFYPVYVGICNYTTKNITAFNQSLLRIISDDFPQPPASLKRELASSMRVSMSTINRWFRSLRQQNLEESMNSPQSKYRKWFYTSYTFNHNSAVKFNLYTCNLEDNLIQRVSIAVQLCGILSISWWPWTVGSRALPNVISLRVSGFSICSRFLGRKRYRI